MAKKQSTDTLDDDFLDAGETVQSKMRKKDAARIAEARKEKAEPARVWYAWKKEPTLNPKKGRKLLRYTGKKSGAICEFIGFEKKMPKGFLKTIEGKFGE